MIKVIKKGLETSVQDYPGRIGTLNQGFPPSGPMDSWSFRLANVLVQNDPGAPALECQFMGPSLKFENDAVIAITGQIWIQRLMENQYLFGKVLKLKRTKY